MLNDNLKIFNEIIDMPKVIKNSDENFDSIELHKKSIEQFEFLKRQFNKTK